jgi:hypothetical protein
VCLFLHAMANPTLSYFLPPQWEFEHETGPILLGSIISNPKLPQYALNADNRLPLPPLFLNKGKPSFKVTLTVDSTQTAGLDLSLFSLFGFDGGFGIERGKKQTYTIDAVERLTQEINPSTEWVAECFKLSAIVKHLQDKGHKDLYLITGIMAAMSATVESIRSGSSCLGVKPVSTSPLPVFHWALALMHPHRITAKLKRLSASPISS